MKKLFLGLGIAVALSGISLTTLAQALSADTKGLPPLPAGTTNPTSAMMIPPPPDVSAKAYVLMDVNSGTIIAERNMNDRMPPASLTKLMTLFLTSQALKNRAVNMNDQVLIGKDAWQTGGSRMFVKVGTTVPLNLLIQGIIVASGNDATMAVADHVGGSMSTFVDMMNQQAQVLGMKDSHFTDPTGLPEPTHYTTGYDLALLARAIWLDFPEYRNWYKQKWLQYNNIRQPNRDRLLWRYPYAVGMKTGHTDEAGYCLVGMAVYQGMTLVAVVLNTPSDEERANSAIKLLSYGFKFFESHFVYQAGSTIVKPRVWYGKENNIPVGTLYDVYVTTPSNGFRNAQAVINVNSPLMAPIKKGQQVGTLSVTLDNKTIAAYPLVALADDARSGMFGSMASSIAFHSHKMMKKTAEKPIIINLGQPAQSAPAPAISVSQNGAPSLPAVQPLSVGK